MLEVGEGDRVTQSKGWHVTEHIGNHQPDDQLPFFRTLRSDGGDKTHDHSSGQHQDPHDFF